MLARQNRLPILPPVARTNKTDTPTKPRPLFPWLTDRPTDALPHSNHNRTKLCWGNGRKTSVLNKLRRQQTMSPIHQHQHQHLHLLSYTLRRFTQLRLVAKVAKCPGLGSMESCGQEKQPKHYYYSWYYSSLPPPPPPAATAPPLPPPRPPLFLLLVIYLTPPQNVPSSAHKLHKCGENRREESARRKRQRASDREREDKRRRRGRRRSGRRREGANFGGRKWTGYKFRAGTKLEGGKKEEN